MSEDSKAAFHAKRLPADAWVHTSPDELRKYQTEHGVSQSGLARHLHANSEALKTWLNGTKIPSLVMQQRFQIS